MTVRVCHMSFAANNYNMFHSLKGKFQQVQDGISASIRALTLKDDKPNDLNASLVNFYAGAEIVLRNEREWGEMHSALLENKQKAETIDQKIFEVHSKMKKQLDNLQQITNFVNNIPKFMKKVENISNKLVSMENMVKEAEEFLIIFEDLVETEEYNQKETNEKFEYSAYIEKKNKEIEFVRTKLEEQYHEKLSLKEKQIDEVLKERQELFNMAFQEDMKLYKESGIIPNIRSSEVSSCITLEDVIIEDDLQGLNELLES